VVQESAITLISTTCVELSQLLTQGPQSQVVFLIKLQGAHMTTITYNPSELQRTVHKK